MDHFSYERYILREPDKTIRLLTLLPARSYDSPIHARLSCHEMTTRQDTWRERIRVSAQLPPYMAVSYVWGDAPARDSCIFIAGAPFYLSKNVTDALRTLRAYSSVSMLYWIDYICINQADETEKNSQVPLMPYIYSRSMCVMVWLGAPTPESEKATDFINRLTLDPLAIEIMKLYELDLPSVTPGQTSEEAPARGRWEKVWREVIWAVSVVLLRLMLTVAWMNRVLIDGVRSPRHAQNSRRKYAVKSVEAFKKSSLTVVPRMKHDGHLPGQPELKLRKGAVLPAATQPGIAAIGKETLLREKPATHHGVVQLSKGMPGWTPTPRCLDAVASVDLAEMAELIGTYLFKNTNYFGRMWTLQEAIVREEVFIAHGSLMTNFSQVVQAVSYLTQHLKHEVHDSDKVAQLRWIGSEHAFHRRLPLLVLLWEARERKCGDPRDKIYALRGLMFEKPTILIEPKYSLPVAAVYANTARFLISTNRSLDIICGRDPAENAVEGLPSWTPDFSRFGAGDVVPLLDLSGRESRHSASLQEPPTFLPDLNTIPKDWHRLQVSGIYLGTITRLSPSFQCDESIDDLGLEWQKPAKEFSTTHRAILLHRRLFLVDSEEVLGAAPDHTKETDHIFVLIGCSVPVILRKWPDSADYQLVGEAYCEGFMQGEALSKRGPDDANVKEIWLR